MSVQPGTRAPDPRPRGGTIVDAVAFAATFAVALVQGWTPSDIVWSLWISSLVAGGAVIALPWVIGALSPDFAQIPAGQRGLRFVLIRLVILGIFLGVFGLMHTSYAMMLESLVEAPGPALRSLQASGEAAALPAALGELLGRYWPVVAGTALVMLRKFVDDVRTGDDDVILGPWRIMPRLHALLLAFMLLHGLGVRSAFAAVAFVILYFPVDRALWQRLRLRRRRT